MLWGFFMKLVVADRLALYVDSVYNNSAHHEGKTLALATVFFAIQIYCDFAGYSNIAMVPQGPWDLNS
jgi:D-alanyl-lipoteichoic acid acyltransferase DltB (MBOAT superfamily)